MNNADAMDKVQHAAPEPEGNQNIDPAPGDDRDSVATSDVSVSSLNSEEMSLAPAQHEAGGYGLRGIHGRHGERQRDAIEKILPVLREQLETEGALSLSDKENVKIAVDIASGLGLGCWGPDQVYKSKRNVESAILNLYFQSVLASLHT